MFIVFSTLSLYVSIAQRNAAFDDLEHRTHNHLMNLIAQGKSSYQQIHMAVLNLNSSDCKRSMEIWEQSADRILRSNDAITLIEYGEYELSDMDSRLFYLNRPIKISEDQGGFTEFLPFSKEDDKIEGVFLSIDYGPLFIGSIYGEKDSFQFALRDQKQVLYSSDNWADVQGKDICISEPLNIPIIPHLVMTACPTDDAIHEISADYLRTQILSFVLGLFSILILYFAQRFYKFYKLNENRFKNLLDEVTLATVMIDTKGTIIYCNDYFLQKSGWQREEVIGINYFTRFVPQDYIDEKVDVFGALIEGQKIPSSEIPLVTKSGKILWFLLDMAPLRNTKGEIIGAAGVGNDVTENKENSERLETQLEFSKTLIALDQNISSRKTLHDILKPVLGLLLARFSINAAAILIYDEIKKSYVYEVGEGFKTTLVESVSVQQGEGFTGRAARDNKEVWSCELQDDQIDFTHFKILKEESFSCYRAIPMVVNEETIGILELYCSAPFDYDELNAGFIRTLAQHTAIAIDDTNLYNNLKKRNRELSEAYDSTIEGWSRALDLRDKETENHSVRVTDMTLRICTYAGIDGEELTQIRRGALLHDIGKMGIPDRILLKVEKLTEEEWNIIKKHPTLAYELLYPIDYLHPALDIPYCHHEKWDGTGYPRGLKGEEIPFAARIFAVVDVWDALLSDRPYRKGWPPEKVYEHIRSLSGSHFDPEAVRLFFDAI